MGLYEKDFDLGIDLGKPAVKLAALIVAFVVIVVILYFLAASVLQPRAITATLNEPELRLKEKQFTLLNVVITNVTPETARGIEVRVEAEDSQSIIIGTSGSDTENIELIESGLTRKIHFLVAPKEGVKEGAYRIKVSATINGQNFEESVVLRVIPD